MSVGDSVYVDPKSSSFVLPKKSPKRKPDTLDDERAKDPDRYPELYRKNKHIKGSNDKAPPPYSVGRVMEIKKAGDGLTLRLRKLYRPENTHLCMNLDPNPVAQPYSLSMRLLYWSDDTCLVPSSDVRHRTKC